MEMLDIQLAKARKIMHSGMELSAKEDRLRAYLDAKAILEELAVQCPANPEVHHDLGVAIFALTAADQVQGDNVALERYESAIQQYELAIQHGYEGDGGCARAHIVQILRRVSALAQNEKNSKSANEILSKFLPKYNMA